MEMFERINKKLTDDSFIMSMQKIPRTVKLEEKVVEKDTRPAVKKTDYKALTSMSDDEAHCYAQRYTDLAGVEPREHFFLVGKAQSRIKTCEQNLTDIQAEYLLRQ
jgi:hypothetical protein